MQQIQSKKAKVDVFHIANGMDYQPLYIYRYIDENEDDYALMLRIDGITAGVAYEDIVVYQYPSYNGAHFDRMFLQRMKQIGFTRVYSSMTLRCCVGKSILMNLLFSMKQQY